MMKNTFFALADDPGHVSDNGANKPGPSERRCLQLLSDVLGEMRVLEQKRGILWCESQSTGD